MEIKGTITEIFPLVEGGNGEKKWKRQDFLINTGGQYAKDVVLSCFGKVVDVLEKNNIGDTVSCSFDLSSREHNGKWYTSVNVFKIVTDSSAKKQPAKQSSSSDNEDQLPF